MKDTQQEVHEDYGSKELRELRARYGSLMREPYAEVMDPQSVAGSERTFQPADNSSGKYGTNSTSSLPTKSSSRDRSIHHLQMDMNIPAKRTYQVPCSEVASKCTSNVDPGPLDPQALTSMINYQDSEGREFYYYESTNSRHISATQPIQEGHSYFPHQFSNDDSREQAFLLRKQDFESLLRQSSGQRSNPYQNFDPNPSQIPTRESLTGIGRNCQHRRDCLNPYCDLEIPPEVSDDFQPGVESTGWSYEGFNTDY